jgi:hypothetical protein
MIPPAHKRALGVLVMAFPPVIIYMSHWGLLFTSTDPVFLLSSLIAPHLLLVVCLARSRAIATRAARCYARSRDTEERDRLVKRLQGWTIFWSIIGWLAISVTYAIANACGCQVGWP